MNDTPGTIWTQVYTPSRRKFSVTLDAATDIDALIAKLLEFDSKATAAGLLVDEPGLEAGEQTETIHYALRTLSVNSRGESVRMYLYTERFNWKFIATYLDNIEDTANFTRATGLVVTDMPLYEGDSALERGKNPQRDAKYLVPLRNPVKIVWKQNPAWTGDDDKDHAKRLFVRWQSLTPTPPTNGTRPSPPSQPPPETSSNGNGAPAQSAQAAIQWPSADAISTVLTHMQRATGIVEMSVSEFARLCGIESADDLDAWSAFDSGRAAYEAALKQFEAQQKAAEPKEYHATVTEASYHIGKDGKYLEFRAPGVPRTYGRTTTFKDMVGDDYYIANKFDGMEAADKLDKPQPIAPLEIWWEHKVSHNPDGSVKSDYMLVTKARPVTREEKRRVS